MLQCCTIRPCKALVDDAKAASGLKLVLAGAPGRMLIAQGAIDACKIGVTIAVRYGCMRPQFNGKVVMTYLTHQRRLLPALATTYAMHLLGLRLKARGRRAGGARAGCFCRWGRQDVMWLEARAV